MYKLLIIFILTYMVYACIPVKCLEDKVYLFDRRGRPIPGKKKKDPPAFMIKRCPTKSCQTRKVHCHGAMKYRGSPWWKNQNPEQGQDFEIKGEK
ncbi:MAG: hypothetical protein NW207_09560 [Cytophagales bacterium]|nr:hypothetical protein [Cytophagales bacterium]